MNNYTSNKPYDPIGFKEQAKIKYKATKAVAGKFPKGTALMEPFSRVQPAILDWATYCALTADQQLVWE